MRLAILALCAGLAAATAAAAPLPSLNDEFDVPGSAAQWQEIKGDLADGVVPTWDIAQSTPDELTVTHFTYIRRDLPVALTAGIDAFSGYGDTKADLVSHVDWIHFAPTGVPGALRRAVLAGKRPSSALTRFLTRA